jgi:hypothetical protein
MEGTPEVMQIESVFSYLLSFILFHEAKLEIFSLQIYGKTLKYGRISPIFFNFAPKFNIQI